MEEITLRLRSIIAHAEAAVAAAAHEEGAFLRIELQEIAGDLRVAREYAEKMEG